MDNVTQPLGSMVPIVAPTARYGLICLSDCYFVVLVTSLDGSARGNKIAPAETLIRAGWGRWTGGFGTVGDSRRRGARAAGNAVAWWDQHGSSTGRSREMTVSVRPRPFSSVVRTHVVVADHILMAEARLRDRRLRLPAGSTFRALRAETWSAGKRRLSEMVAR